MENFEPIQTMIGDLTIEQFCHVLGISFGIFTVSCFCVFFVFCFLNSFLNGRLHYKVKEYYGSFRYLNKRFKSLKSATDLISIRNEALQLRNSIELLRYQRVIPEFLYVRLIATFYEIYEKKFFEVHKNEDN